MMGVYKSLNVLILEDDAADAELMVDALCQAGYNPVWQRVQTKEDYLDHLDPTLDLILADHGLPQFNAISALKLLETCEFDIPFIIVSGTIGEELAVAAIKLGADDYIIKDRLSRLGSAVTNALKTKTLRVERRQAEEKLQKNEAKFRFLAEHAQDIIYLIDLFPTPHLSYISPAVTHISGYTPEEHYADPELVWKRLYPDQLSAVQTAVEKVRTGAPLTDSNAERMELRWLTKAGQFIWLEQHSSSIYDDTGQCIAIVGVARDITERKLIEEERYKLSRAVEQSSSSIMITDVKGNIEYVNPKFTERTGYTAAEAIGQNPRLLKSGYTPPEEYARLWQTITSGGEWHGEFHNKTKTGHLYWESASISPIFNEQGETTHFLAVKEDISERKRREQVQEALLASANLLRAANSRAELLAVILRRVASILDASLTFVVSADATSDESPDGFIVEALYHHDEQNPFMDMVNMRLPTTGNVSAEVYNSGIPLLNNGALADPLLDKLLLESTGENVACVPLRTPDETVGVFWVVRKTPFSPDDVRLLIAITDMVAAGLQRVTLHDRLVRHAASLEQEVAVRTRELQVANDHLLELDRLKSKFVSDVSHELRTPVTNMGLYLDLIGLKPEKREQYATVLHEQVDRLETLVKEVLDLSRLDSRQNIQMTPVSLNDLVAQVVSAHQARVISQDLLLTFMPDLDLPLVLGNADKLLQIVTNLVTNAVNYTRNGTIKIRTYAATMPGKALLEVADTGMGIHEEDIPHIFDRFYRGKQDSTVPVPGTGLGLSIVKELVELHHGSIEVQSQFGVGTTFTLTLPVVEIDGGLI